MQIYKGAEACSLSLKIGRRTRLLSKGFGVVIASAGTFLSMAESRWEMVVTQHNGKTTLTVRGPETKATTADCPAEGEWVAIRFKLGTFMPLLPAINLRDRRDVTLPEATGRSFWLNGSVWEYPDFENAETFVKRLVHDGLIAVDHSVDAACKVNGTKCQYDPHSGIFCERRV
jgi:hypothetical protein